MMKGMGIIRERPGGGGSLPITALICTHLFMFTAASIAKAADAPEWMRGGALNVVLSIEKTAEMRKFYGETLGLESQPDIKLPARVGRPFDTIMIRYLVGRTVIKMIPSEGLTRLPGGRDAANGFRVLSIPILDGDAIGERIERGGGKALKWERAEGCRVAFTRDPDDNEIELRWYSQGADAASLVRVEVVLTTGDLDLSRRHYGEWLGLAEVEPLELPGFPGKTHRLRAGDSVIRLWSSGKELQRDAGFTTEGYGLRYVQFIVRDADELHQQLRGKGAKIAQEPTPLGESALLLFLADPDGVINECVGPGRKKTE